MGNRTNVDRRRTGHGAVSAGRLCLPPDRCVQVWRLAPTPSLPAKSIKELYYITHVNNIPSILGQGILSHELILSKGIPYTRVYDEEIVSNRQRITTPNGKTLWVFANVYFQPRNPMLYRVTR